MGLPILSHFRGRIWAYEDSQRCVKCCRALVFTKLQVQVSIARLPGQIVQRRVLRRAEPFRL